MTIFISGICGFVGSSLARWFKAAGDPPRQRNQRAASPFYGHWHGDVRQPADLENLPRADWVIDAAANPSLLAGVDGRSSAARRWNTICSATLNLLEYAKANRVGFILLSSSRVYSIPALALLPFKVVENAFELDAGAALSAGISLEGIGETFSVAPPVSLYGSTNRLLKSSLGGWTLHRKANA
jgi:CDP-paratose 2-epimerase